jgi:hypothetical protein
MTKLYVSTDVDVTLTVGSTLAISDISSISITLSRVEGAESVTFTSASGAAIIGASNIVLRIPRTSITVAGTYAIRITYVEPGGAVRGPYLDIENLVFN